MNLLEIKNLKKYYHDLKGEILAIDNISLTIKEQEFISIIGTSGCGKSTLLSILAGLENKSDGEIIFNKKDFKIGYMLQNDSLFPWRTVLDNCLIGLEIEKSLTPLKKKKVIDLLNKYGLKDFINMYPDSLSGGMRQRVALIRTLAIDPDILLLDEPLSALDYQTRLSLSNDLYKIIKEEKKTAIMVTHDLAEAISMSDRIVVLSKRPSKVKSIFDINYENRKTPTENRKEKEFDNYYNTIWKEIDLNVQ